MENFDHSNIIKESFDKLISNYKITDTEEGTGNNSYDNNDSTKINVIKTDDFVQNNFCNNVCKEKFLNVMEKIKSGNLDLTKITFNSNQNTLATDETQNFFRDVIVQFYNAGYYQAQINPMENSHN
jgi:hypothetical protein